MLHGAIETILQISGAVPLIHSTAGCSVQHNYSGFSIPSSNLFERQVIFGATSRLREQIKNTVKVANGELYVVLSGCTAELIGDDVPAMVKEAEQQGEKITFVEAAGFKGSFHDGYVATFKKLADYLLSNENHDQVKEVGLVNILGIVPNQDIFWQGELLEIKRIMENIGLKVNTLFGIDGTIDEWEKISNAQLNLVLSPWGIEIAEYLKKKFETPYLNLNNLPVGLEETSKFLVEVSKTINIEEKIVSDYIEKERLEFNYYFNKLSQLYYDYDLQRNFALVVESGLVVGITKFLTNTLGLIPAVIIVTDKVDVDYKNYVNSELKTSEIVFTDDSRVINEYITERNIELIIGSSLEKAIAEKLNVPFVLAAYPAIDELILNRSFVGFRGAIELLEILFSTIQKHERLINKQLENEILQLINN
ncbi:oxalate:formate antiporter [Clostridium sp. DJ247]|nr:oxalate:formate antiporter [Clostridium sp. DJ247]